MIVILQLLSLSVVASPVAKITVKNVVGNEIANYSDANDARKFSLSFRDTDIDEALAMLASKSRVNIILSKNIQGDISLNLYDVTLDQAVRSIAKATGYEVEKRYGSYYVLLPSEASENLSRGVTTLRTFKVQYTDTAAVESILKNHLSKHGKITTLPGRNLIVIEDTFEFVSRVEKLLKEIDKKPRQILIEAKILEISLNDGETFGLDWNQLFTFDGEQGNVGTRGFSSPGATGFFLDLVTPNVEVALQALNGEGRVRTLSTPKLLALENQEASVVIGDRIGYRLTTTINQVTTESIEFLESGVILKVKPSVDANDHVLLDIHPEVSTGSVLEGIPSQTTTEVTTQLLVENGQTVFIGGLIKQSVSESHDGVPVLGSIPLIGSLFQHSETTSVNTETVVMITPYIVEKNDNVVMYENALMVDSADIELKNNSKLIEKKVNDRYSENHVTKLKRSHDDKDVFNSWNNSDELDW